MSQREEWIKFVCNPNKPTRYLTGLGDSVGIEVSEIADTAISDFLGKLLRKGEDPWALVNSMDLIFGEYSKFLSEELKHLLRSLSHKSFSDAEVQGPSVKGKVNWSGTLVARATRRLNETRYLVRRPTKSYDVPENQLLKLLLTKLFSDLEKLKRYLGTGNLHQEFSKMQGLVDRALRDFNLRTVTDLKRSTPELISKANKNRNIQYRKVADLVKKREMASDAVSTGRLQSLLSLSKSGWLGPVKDDDLYEFYVLCLCLDVLEIETGLGEPTEIGLLTRNRSHVAKFEKKNLNVTVYFDQSPAAVFGVKTRYGEAMSLWKGITGGQRRPDIMLEFSNGKSKHYLIIEIKRSEDDRYMRDSLYKLFGYLYDFHELWDKASVTPKAALFFPDNIVLTAMPGKMIPFRILSSAQRNQLVDFFQEVIRDI